jgi:hypothetical protein
MEILTKKQKELLRLCKKELHWYPKTDKYCKQCRKKYQKEYQKKYVANNKDVLKEKQRHYYKKNKEKIKQKSKKYRENNRDFFIEYQKQHYRKNKTKYQKYFKKYLQENKKAILANVSKYKANKRKATPVWANNKLIQNIYKNCPEGFHVDHIYPLRSPIMCGLHVENNLQYLKAEQNIAKNNKVNFKDQLIEIEPANWIYLMD